MTVIRSPRFGRPAAVKFFSLCDRRMPYRLDDTVRSRRDPVRCSGRHQMVAKARSARPLRPVIARRAQAAEHQATAERIRQRMPEDVDETRQHQQVAAAAITRPSSYFSLTGQSLRARQVVAGSRATMQQSMKALATIAVRAGPVDPDNTADLD